MMMKRKKLSEEQLKLRRMSKSRKKILFLSNLLFLVFLLGINAFAWFIYITKAQVGITANVVGWDVKFFNDSTATDYFDVNVASVYPGMPDFNKIIEINNKSDIDGSFSYELSEISLFGNTLPLKDQELIDYMKKHYPFILNFASSSNVIKKNEIVQFSVDVKWPYESSTPNYYLLDSFHSYRPSFVYYTFDGNKYNVADVNEQNFESLKNTLYLGKDDMDSFFGAMCGDYKEKTGKACMLINLKLSVEQLNSK